MNKVEWKSEERVGKQTERRRSVDEAGEGGIGARE